MKASAGLRKRLTLGLLGYALLLTIAVAAQGYFVNERAERLVWESMLESEMSHFEARPSAEPGYRWSDTETLRLFGGNSGRAIPTEFADLPPGVHDELKTSAGQFVVLVHGEGETRTVLALEITEMEHAEQQFLWTIAMSSAAVVLLLVFVTYLGVGRLLRPLTDIAKFISTLAPNRYEQRVPVDRSAPQEAIVIADGLNEYLQRLDHFVEREREFIRTASHELRTPVAVIAGAAEVGVDVFRRGSSPAAQLESILRTTREMQQLIALLLALAKDPSRLQSSLEPVDLAELVPSVLQDHQFLAQPKELSFECAAPAICVIQAPRAVARAAIANLVRNAVENSARGTIRVAIEPGTIVVEDPGRGMSEVELSHLYSRLARDGAATGGGVGIELIARLCEHLGWQLRFASEPGRGTVATLRFGSD